MATAKKAAVKKTVAKKVPAKKKVVKKTTAKKAVKKAAPAKKRAYNRKPKADTPQQESQAEVETMVDLGMILEDLLNGEEAADTDANSTGESYSSILSKSDVLDLRDLNTQARVGLMYLLTQEGYIWSHLSELEDHLPTFLMTETIRLDHVHKLVTAMSYDNLPPHVTIAKVYVRTDVHVVMDEPVGKAPSTIAIGDSTYVRVS